MMTWHLGWQELFAAEYREVLICNEQHRHRADICLPQPDDTLLIIEFQSSSIPASQVCSREQFYTQLGHLLWVFDARNFQINLAPTSPNSDIYEFTWVRSRSSLWTINSSLAFDFGNIVLLIAQGHQRSSKHLKSSGWGWIYRKEEFGENRRFVSSGAACG